jgi:hypothetical protein
MTVRTRKTIVDLISGLKAQEKEIKSQLSDSQRRLNEIRDRIATCYWVIEEVADVGTDEVVEDVWEDDFMELSNLPRITTEEWEELVLHAPHLSYYELEEILISQGFLPPLPYTECPCSDCASTREKNKQEYKEASKIKLKPKAKPLPVPKKKPTKKPSKKGKK